LGGEINIIIWRGNKYLLERYIPFISKTAFILNKYTMGKNGVKMVKEPFHHYIEGGGGLKKG